jgi:hypothetical protein
MPEKIEKKFDSLKIPNDIERSMHQSVLVSHLLDSEQQKLPHRETLKPDKPKHFLPRFYGITDQRKK